VDPVSPVLRDDCISLICLCMFSAIICVNRQLFTHNISSIQSIKVCFCMVYWSRRICHLSYL